MKNLLFFLFVTVSAYAQAQTKLIFKSDFSNPLDCKEWVAEIDNLPGHTSTVYTHNNALVLDTWGGVTNIRIRSTCWKQRKFTTLKSL